MSRVCSRVPRDRKTKKLLALHRQPFWLFCLLVLGNHVASSQAVTTQHYDNARTGQNTSELVLTPRNVNSSSFGRLFSVAVDGYVYSQPLYSPNLNISGKGQHNVLFVVTAHDSVYAIDADVAAPPLWQATLLDSAHGAAPGAATVPSSDLGSVDLIPEVGISSTPVIDSSSGTLYVVSKSQENGNVVQRLHALDVSTGAEKFAGPRTIQASVPGTGVGSSGGTLSLDPKWAHNRAGLLLLNGIVYIGFGSHGDNGPWHGWILSYDAVTLQQKGVFCTTPNGIGSGIWMSGTGLAADRPDPQNHPFGRMFIATGNGTFDASPLFGNHMDYGDDHIRLDLDGALPRPVDHFTPYAQDVFNEGDMDLGSGGIILLPDQSGTSHPHLLMQVNKVGTIYLVDRDNMGGYSTTDNIVQKIDGQTKGLWSAPAYWNNKIYLWGNDDYLKAFSFRNGLLSTTPIGVSAEHSFYPGSTPVVSANGNLDGVVWTIRSDSYGAQSPAVLQAHDAENVLTLLYSSDQSGSRDNAGNAVKFSVPMVVNGKVYVGAQYAVTAYGLLNAQPAAASPVFSPGPQAFTGTIEVSLSSSTPAASIYFSTDGSAPNTSSTRYSSPILVSATQTIRAVSVAPNYGPSAVVAATYVNQGQVSAPQFLPNGGTYASAQQVSIADDTPGATIYFTVDGSTPTSQSNPYTGPITISSTSVLKAIATLPQLPNSPVSSAAYTIAPAASVIDFGSGFSQSANSMVFNGSTGLDDSRLQLTNGGFYQAGSAFYKTAIDIRRFTSDFSFQLSNAAADGFTFAIQNVAPTALGQAGSGLGYGPYQPGGSGAIANSVALKFDLFSNVGEGQNSIGLYTGGNSPTLPATDLTAHSIDLHSGDIINAHLVYDGTNLTLTLTDTVTQAQYTTSWSVDVATQVGANSAFVGFTGATGGYTASQKILTWSFASMDSSPSPTPPTPTPDPTPTPAPAGQVFDFSGGFSAASSNILTNGSATLNGLKLRLTSGGYYQSGSAFYKSVVDIRSFATDFTFQVGSAVADGFTFVVQTAGMNSLGQAGSGLGYGPYQPGGTGSIPKSVALKFDLYNNIGESGNSVGLYSNGASPTTPFTDLTGTGIDLHNGNVMAVHLVFDGTNLALSLTDTVTKTVFTKTWVVDIPGIVGDTTAFVGFTGATGGYTAIQEILGWSYSSSTAAPAPTAPPTVPGVNFGNGFTTAANTMVVNGSAFLNGSVLQLCKNDFYQAGSAFFATPLNIQHFTTDFKFQVLNAAADGFTFTAQGVGANALGQAGGGLGFGPYDPNGSGGIAKSLAVTFDLFSNRAEGGNTVGFYLNGKSPTDPGRDLTSVGLDLHSGHIMQAHITYDGSALSLLLTDSVTKASLTASWPINIASVTGGNTAYVGFTGATGGYTSTQTIASWTFSSE